MDLEEFYCYICKRHHLHGEICSAKNQDKNIMKKYSLWMEGYQATGDHASATYLGEFEAKTFREAVEKWSYTLSKKDASLLNLKTCSYWGCNIFDNEEDARKHFG